MEDHPQDPKEKEKEEALVNGLMEAADRVARQSPQEQEAWLQKLRQTLGDMPDIERVVEGLRAYLAASRAEYAAQRQAFVAQCRKEHCTEQSETMWIAWLNELLAGSRQLSPDPQRRLHFLLHLVTWGHLLPGLHERLMQPDGINYLLALLRDHPVEPEPE